jgi:hypothetical protein
MKNLHDIAVDVTVCLLRTEWGVICLTEWLGDITLCICSKKDYDKKLA